MNQVHKLMPRLYLPMPVLSAVVYLNSGDNVCMAMSKARVAPLKATTLPRLELMVAVTATKLEILL